MKASFDSNTKPAALMVLAVCFALSGCLEDTSSGSTNEDTSMPSPTEPEPEEDEQEPSYPDYLDMTEQQFTMSNSTINKLDFVETLDGQRMSETNEPLSVQVQPDGGYTTSFEAEWDFDASGSRELRGYIVHPETGERKRVLNLMANKGTDVTDDYSAQCYWTNDTRLGCDIQGTTENIGNSTSRSLEDFWEKPGDTFDMEMDFCRISFDGGFQCNTFYMGKVRLH